MKSLSALRLLVASLVLCFSSAALQVSEDKLIVGVLQSGGAIIPIARYDGTRWTNTWPAPIERSILPSPSLTQIPAEWLGGEAVPSNWRVWLPSGSTHETRVTGLQYSKTSCGENWGLGTNFPKALNICPNCCPDAIGLALSTERPMWMMRPADQSRLPFAVLERAFSESENREIVELNTSRRPAGRPYYGPPLDIKARSVVPIRVERAWMMGLSSGETVYYVEANKRYPNLNGSVDTGCPHVSAFRGWFSRNAAADERALSSRLEVTDCDFKTAVFTTPMGLMELKSGNYVMVQNNAWESQSYGVLKVESGSVISLVETPLR